MLAQLAGGLFDKRPDGAGKWAQLLDGAPGGRDRLEGGARQGSLAAVVEVGLVGQGGQLGAEISWQFGACVYILAF